MKRCPVSLVDASAPAATAWYKPSDVSASHSGTATNGTAETDGTGAVVEPESSRPSIS